ncbi:MAG: hypothetical protein ACPGLY_27200 [Rubripirellula sp.]
MSDKLEIMWQVEDGYAGGARPQYTTVDEGELDECDSEEEVLDLIIQTVQEHFDDCVHASWNSGQDQKILKVWREMKGK